uniref:SH2 domain-containing protein n=1 Tax=Cynoglossus semilaevis TaxID=244447 RepID=A0A3P8UFD2_CYNSE
MQGLGGSQRGSQRVFSVLDRLLLTHPVWLQLSLNHDSALYILLREPVGTFLVRKCSATQRKVLCLRVTADRSTSSVKECFICEEDSRMCCLSHWGFQRPSPKRQLTDSWSPFHTWVKVQSAVMNECSPDLFFLMFLLVFH